MKAAAQELTTDDKVIQRPVVLCQIECGTNKINQGLNDDGENANGSCG